MSQPDRREWIAAAMQEYEARLVRYAARLTRDDDQARDVVQEAFARLCRQVPGELNGRLGPWLFAVCRNRALEVRRKDIRMVTDASGVLEMTADVASDPAVAASDREETGGLLRMVASLPDDQQEVVRLKFQEQMSYREIAEVTGHSVSNVGVLLHTAIKKLRAGLGGK